MSIRTPASVFFGSSNPGVSTNPTSTPSISDVASSDVVVQDSIPLPTGKSEPVMRLVNEVLPAPVRPSTSTTGRSEFFSAVLDIFGDRVGSRIRIF